MNGATDVVGTWDNSGIISIHAPRERGDFYPPSSGLMFSISIHAPRERGDLRVRIEEKTKGNISIHAPRERGDNKVIKCTTIEGYFNPRPA